MFERFVIPAPYQVRGKLQQESRIPGENRDPGLKMLPDPQIVVRGRFRRDDVQIPVYTGMKDRGAFRRAKVLQKRTIFLIAILVLIWTNLSLAAKDLEIKGKQLISQKPPFTFTLPSELSMIYSFSNENPAENSLTRAYFLVRVKGKQVEEMLILQIADKTNPQAGPITVQPLKPYIEKRMYSKNKVKKERLEIDYIIQLMAWNPDALSLQPIVKKGILIPSHWALQGQFLFTYQGEHAVLVRYSRDIHSFGFKISEEGKDWERGSISGNEMKTREAFQKIFIEMINSIGIKNP